MLPLNPAKILCNEFYTMRTILNHPALNHYIQFFLSNNRRVLKNILRGEIDFTALSPQHKILEIGCSTALTSNILPKYCYYGSDLGQRELAYAKKKYHHKLNLLAMDARYFSFPESSLDWILSICMLHHIKENQLSKVFEEMKRCLRADGKILFIDNVEPKSIFTAFTRIYNYLDRGSYIRTADFYLDLLPRHFTIEKHHIIRSYPFDCFLFIPIDLCVFILRS